MPTYSTFDPYAPAQLRMTLSGGNLTATTGSGGLGFALSQEGKSSGKHYCEITCTTIGNPSGICVVNALAGGGTRMAFNSSQNDGCGYFAGGGIYKDGSNLWSTDSFTAADKICVALDCDNKKVWFRKNGGSWRGATSASADPATNSNGIDITTNMTRGRMFIGFSGENSGNVVVANFGATAFAQSVPSGFTSGLTVADPNFLGSLFMGAGPIPVQAPPGLSSAVCKFSLGANQNVTSIDFVFEQAGTQNLKAVVYAADGTSSLPGTFKGQSSAIAAFVMGENNFAFASPLQLTAGDYWLGLSTNISSYLATAACAALTNGIKYKATSYTTPDDPFPSSPSNNDSVYPMLVHYAAYSGEAPPATAGGPGMFVVT